MSHTQLLQSNFQADSSRFQPLTQSKSAHSCAKRSLSLSCSGVKFSPESLKPSFFGTIFLFKKRGIPKVLLYSNLHYDSSHLLLSTSQVQIFCGEERYFPPRSEDGSGGERYREVGFLNINWQAGAPVTPRAQGARGYVGTCWDALGGDQWVGKVFK